MSREDSNWQWSTRHPRYPAASPEDRTCAIARVTCASADEFEDANLIDISMTGIQICIGSAIESGKQIEVEIVTKDGCRIIRTCNVQWCQMLEESHYKLGCRFGEQLTYEELGELFLSEAIERN